MPLEEFHHFPCPYCSRPNTLAVDLTGGPRQNFVVDCEILSIDTGLTPNPHRMARGFKFPGDCGV